MSGFVQDVEQDFDSSQQGSNDQSQQSSNDQSSNQQSSGSSSSGGLMSDVETAGEDVAVDQEVNSFMTKEGVPAGADGLVDGFVNKEI